MFNPSARWHAAPQWYPLSEELPPLAFDHNLVVRTALRRLAQEGASGGGGGAAREGLQQALLRAADRLEGPWQQQQQQA